MNGNVSTPRCFIDVYPYEGGQFTISGNSAAFLGVSTSKAIASGGNGSFSLNLAPGGPYGLNSRPTWLDLFTPFSLVVIGMQRGLYASVVMVGVVISASESQQRSPDEVRRAVRIQGEDFTRLFSIFCYYDLTFLLGSGISSTNKLGLPTNVADALQGPPHIVGAAWYNKIMAGPGSIMAQTSFAYRDNRPTFFDIMSTWFEAYPSSVQIPTMASFIADEGSWMNKFLTFFPRYMYEVFVQTAPIGYYPAATMATIPIVMDGFPPVSPTFVARVSPQPFLNSSGPAANPTYSMDLSLWNALPNYQLDSNRGSVSQELSYSETEVRNFYIFAPTWMLTTFGASAGSISPFQLVFSQWADVASIHRYGFRPNNLELRWFADPNGTYAKSLAASNLSSDAFSSLIDHLSLRAVAFHEPTPNMLHGTIEMELRPDILPGNTFTFVPYRDGIPWTFYIDSVYHSVQFGTRTSTILDISRGLIDSDYFNNNLLVALHTGNAQRINGQLTIGLPAGLGASLSPVNHATLETIMSGASQLFGSPR